MRKAATREEVFAAARAGDVAAVRRAVIADRAVARLRDRRGRTLLHVAAERKDVALAKLLLDAGAEVDARDAVGRTPFLLAARSPAHEFAYLLQRAGADPLAKDRGGATPLGVARKHWPGLYYSLRAHLPPRPGDRLYRNADDPEVVLLLGEDGAFVLRETETHYFCGPTHRKGERTVLMCPGVMSFEAIVTDDRVTIPADNSPWMDADVVYRRALLPRDAGPLVRYPKLPPSRASR